MSSLLSTWLGFRGMFCAKTHLQDVSFSDDPEDPKGHSMVDTRRACIFCQAYSSNRHAFDVVWEDADFFAFRDARPASIHHIQLIPKVHISSVKMLRRQDADMVRRMESIGNDILDKLNIPPSQRKMGFHIPPFYSVSHLHLHVQALSYTSFTKQFKYPVSTGFGAFDKGFSWFSEVGQTIRVLEKGSTVGFLPC